ncbi:MAG: hypothetical protein EAZ99_00570 [Alphaproteobacteria bacterium]|nr:MAG: hypothetical protein EAZ99_00570 [Alphaproteobacteria bacterium]
MLLFGIVATPVTAMILLAQTSSRMQTQILAEVTELPIAYLSSVHQCAAVSGSREACNRMWTQATELHRSGMQLFADERECRVASERCESVPNAVGRFIPSMTAVVIRTDVPDPLAHGKPVWTRASGELRHFNVPVALSRIQPGNSNSHVVLTRCEWRGQQMDQFAICRSGSGSATGVPPNVGFGNSYTHVTWNDAGRSTTVRGGFGSIGVRSAGG